MQPMATAATPQATKRVVVHIVKGRLAGIPKIIGHLVMDGTEPFPPSIADVGLGDHKGTVQHAGTFPRYVLYREWASPVMHRYGQQTGKDSFDKDQR